MATAATNTVNLCAQDAVHGPAFDMLVIGCGGGPLETNLSSYLVKPYPLEWQRGCTALEAGSALGALARLVETQPWSFTGFNLNIGVDSHDDDRLRLRPSSSSPSSTASPADNRRHWRTKPKRERVSARQRPIGVGREGGGQCASLVWQTVHTFAISHAHLDHIQGLVVSSGACLPPPSSSTGDADSATTAGPRRVYGTLRTLRNIDRVMDGGVWPKLAGDESDGTKAGRAYTYKCISAPTTEAFPLSPHLSCEAYPISHGMDPSCFHSKAKPAPSSPPTIASTVGEAPHECTPAECYDSTAFFIRESMTGQDRELLFWGDVEPDSISKRPLNRAVWQAAAPKIVQGRLTTIFLECSYPSSQPVAQLWGHLSPPFVVEELLVLAHLVVEARLSAGHSRRNAYEEPLKGVTVVIIHIKDDVLPLPTPRTALGQSHSSGSTSTAAVETEQADSGLDSSPQSTTPTSSPSPGTLSAATHSLSLSPPIPSIPTRRASTIASSSTSFYHDSSGTHPSSSGTFSLSLAPPVPSVPHRRPSAIAFTASSGNGSGSGGYTFSSPFAPAPTSASASASASLISLPPASGSTSTACLISEEPTTISDDSDDDDPDDEAGDSDSDDGFEDETVHERIERELIELATRARVSTPSSLSRPGSSAAADQDCRAVAEGEAEGEADGEVEAEGDGEAKAATATLAAAAATATARNEDDRPTTGRSSGLGVKFLIAKQGMRILF